MMRRCVLRACSHAYMCACTHAHARMPAGARARAQRRARVRVRAALTLHDVCHRGRAQVARDRAAGRKRRRRLQARAQHLQAARARPSGHPPMPRAGPREHLADARVQGDARARAGDPCSCAFACALCAPRYNARPHCARGGARRAGAGGRDHDVEAWDDPPGDLRHDTLPLAVAGGEHSSEKGGECCTNTKKPIHPRGADFFQKIAMPSTRSLAVLALGKPHPGARRA